MSETNPNQPPTQEPADAPAPGSPPDEVSRGLVEGGEHDVSERPQADPEVPELGAHDPERG